MQKEKQEKIWETIKTRLEEELELPAYESWIKPVRLVSIEESYLTIAVSSTISKEWIFKNYSKLITDVAQEVSSKKLELAIIIDKVKEIITEIKLESVEEPKKHPLNEIQLNNLKKISNNLNLKYTFDTFVIGAHNKFAHAAALATAKSPAKSHNPLFIYGGVGLGKTHLMQAIGHYVTTNHPGLNIKYTSTEAFTNDLINSIRTDKMSAFRAKYRQIDILLLDDIQFIEGKEITQEEIFHTFNTLYESGKQVVLTSDRHPKKISTLTERLRSRFEWGLLADIQVPDIETRVAILRNKAERDHVAVPDDVLEIIGMAHPNNIRELEGALNRVIAYVSINDCPMTAEVVKNVIGYSGSGNNITVDKIIETTANFFSLEKSDLKGQSRLKDVSIARQIAIYLARDMTNLSFPAIGTAFGGRKHTTILYSYEKMKEEIQTNRTLSEHVSRISKKITSSY